MPKNTTPPRYSVTYFGYIPNTQSYLEPLGWKSNKPQNMEAKDAKELATLIDIILEDHSIWSAQYTDNVNQKTTKIK